MIRSFLFESMTEFSALIRISGLICSPTDSNQQNAAAAFRNGYPLFKGCSPACTNGKLRSDCDYCLECGRACLVGYLEIFVQLSLIIILL